MDLEQAITLGRRLRIEDIEHFNIDDLMLLALRRGVPTDHLAKGNHVLIQALINHQVGPTSTLWGKPLLKRAVDDLEDPKDTLNNPERNIDAVLLFDIAPRDDVGMDASWDRRETGNSYEKRLHVLKCLHAKGLELTQSLSIDQTQWVIRVSAPKSLLELTAERMGKRFKTKLKNTQEEMNAGLLNGYAIFKRDKKTSYDFYTRGFFTSIERQRILLFIIDKALGGNGEDFAMIKKAENQNLFHLFPTHDPADQADLNRMWCSFQAFRTFQEQPLDKIRDYYGEEIAIYFAFLGSYTTWLSMPAGLGIITTALQWKFGQDVTMLPIYISCVALWSIIFLENWKRYQATLQLRWNVREFEDGEVDRIDFFGELRASPITGEDEEHFSDEERCKLYMLTQPIMALSMLVVVIAAVGVVLFQHFAVHSPTFGAYGTEVAGFVNAMVIQIMNMVYAIIANKMNDYENHQTQTDYTDALIMKVFVFQFVNSYAAITYMAFASGRFLVFGMDLKCTRNGCINDIHNLVFMTLSLQIVIGNLTEVASPYITFKLQQYQSSNMSMENQGTGRGAPSETTPLTGVLNAVNPWYDEDDELLNQRAIDDGFELPPFMSKHELEGHMPEYENMFNDYNELVIQFGYVVLFGMALPGGSFLCWVNNCIEIRSDGFKLVNVYQRPFYRGAQDIGTWFDILRAMVVLGVLVNCGMMAFTSNIFLRDNWVDANSVGMVEMLVGVFVAEHIALIIMVFAADFIPDAPASISIDEIRLRDKVELVLRTKDDEDKSRDTLRRYKEMQQLIDDNDIALLEDIGIRKWRRIQQYGSGSLAGIGPPEVKDGDQRGQPSKWMDVQNRMEHRAAEKKEKIFEYDLY